MQISCKLHTSTIIFNTAVKHVMIDNQLPSIYKRSSFEQVLRCTEKHQYHCMTRLVYVRGIAYWPKGTPLCYGILWPKKRVFTRGSFGPRVLLLCVIFRPKGPPLYHRFLSRHTSAPTVWVKCLIRFCKSLDIIDPSHHLTMFLS